MALKEEINAKILDLEGELARIVRRAAADTYVVKRRLLLLEKAATLVTPDIEQVIAALNVEVK